MPEESEESVRDEGASPPAEDAAGDASPSGEESTKDESARTVQVDVPAPGPIGGASKLPPAPIEAIEAIAAAVARLRTEVAATTDKSRKSRLLNEAGEIQERGGDEPGGARDYLAAYNADTSFREPLEGLVRLLERRRSLANLGKLVEALVAAASTPEERARAYTQRAIFFEDVQKDLEGARGAAREATESGAVPADLGAAWLALEMSSAKLNDAVQREEALAGRAQLTTDPTWKGLLLIDAAELAAEAGDIERALEILAKVRGSDTAGAAAWRAAVAIERIVQAEPGLPASDDARNRSKALADALELRADMITEALSDSSRGDAMGVPRYVRRIEHIADLLLRASDARRLGSELGRAAQVLDRCLEVLTDSAPQSEEEPTATGANKEAIATIERLVLTVRIRIAEIAGDTALASELATRRMVGETDGGIVASLAMRTAEHAASEGDIPRALEALTKATERDPLCAPARALKIDILEGGGDAARFAEELEELSHHCTTGPAQGRALVLAAYVWAIRANNATKARAALDRAQATGLSKETVARLGRTLASVRADDEWYEEATRLLVSCENVASELPLLWIELARLRLAQGDEAGATKATAALRDLPQGAWLGRVLDGLASPDLDPTRARTALEELLVEVDDPGLKRSLALVCALRAQAAGDSKTTIVHLEKLAEEDANDPLVAAFLGDLFRIAGDRAAAARIAQSSADAATDDPERAAARHLETGFDRWKLNDRKGAVASFETAGSLSEAAAGPVLAWAMRGIDVDGIAGRRAALERAGSDAGASLERFALEAVMGDPDEAGMALTAVDIASAPNLRLAGALARLIWTKASDDSEALTGALQTLAETGTDGKRAAAAERLRIARDESDLAVAIAAKAWLDAGGGTPASIEWLAASMASGDAAEEVKARRAIAELLGDEQRESMHAGATLLEQLLTPEEPHALVAGSSHAVRLANLELAPPGCDPRRRASALSELDGALGEEAESDALALAAWSALAAGDGELALEVFRTVTATHASDLHAWEGLRTAAELLGDHEAYAVACEQLGARCTNAQRGGAFWEQAALAWMKLGSQFDARAESALDASFARDATRPLAFDKLFRRVRDRKDNDKLLSIVGRRLEVIDDAAEIAKMYWEMARAFREKGDPDAALEALEHVTMFDEDHVGALALTGEIFIRRGMFSEAAEKLARLARVEAAPPKNRVTAGVAAVDLYENKLNRHDAALEVLLALHAARLTTLPVRERLARAAARTGSWTEATRILEELMQERPEREGRAEAARLAMAIHRDRLLAPSAAIPAAAKLLEEYPTDGEALDLIVALDPQVAQRRPMLEAGRDALLMALHETPQNLDTQRRLARIAHALGDPILEQAALSCALALGGPDGSSEQMLALISSKKPRAPQVALSEPMLRQVLAPGDDGPLADLFAALAPTLAEALGPTRDALGVTKKDKVDPKAGLSLRNEIAQWAGALGISAFDLYVGGKDPGAVHAIAGDTPMIIVGSGVNAPLSSTIRGRLARELLGMIRGTTVTRWRDDATIAAIAIAACNIVKVRVDGPPLASQAEVERHINKAINRKTKAFIEPICRAFAASGQDTRQWAARARASQGRIAVLASGDVSVVLADVFVEVAQLGPQAGPQLAALARDDLRAHELLRFVLSRPYFDLRRALGLEV